MTKRSPVSPAPGPLEDYAKSFDDLFGARAQRHGFRRYLEGLLLPAERNKTLTALANTEPVVGAQRKEAQSLQWFLSESRWDDEEVNERRLELLFAEAATAPEEDGVLVIDEHGDRKWGKKTAHVGKQWLGNIGKTENGVVSVSSLWAEEGVYYPLEVEAGPYSPEKKAHRRALVVTTDPERLPRLGTWYLTTNLPAPGSHERQTPSDLALASIQEVVRLYGLRMWVEQSYKQVKHALGWSDYQVRSDLAIRRHWQLVCCAFSFCWWAYGHLPASLEEPTDTQENTPEDTPADGPAERGKRRARPSVSWPEALRAVRGWLEPYVMLWRYWRAYTDLPPPKALRVLLNWVFAGEGIYLYVH